MASRPCSPRPRRRPGGEIARDRGRRADPQVSWNRSCSTWKRGGLLASRRGRSAATTLVKNPAEIQLRQVLRLIDGPIAPLPCLSKTAYRRCDDCRDERACAVRHLFADGYAAMIAALEKRFPARASAGRRRDGAETISAGLLSDGLRAVLRTIRPLIQQLTSATLSDGGAPAPCEVSACRGR